MECLLRMGQPQRRSNFADVGGDADEHATYDPSTDEPSANPGPHAAEEAEAEDKR